MTSIVIVQGHPDVDRARFCRAIGEAYRDGALKGGHSVSMIDVAVSAFRPLRCNAEWEDRTVPSEVAKVQGTIEAAEHIVFIFPLWLGTLPALLKAFLEQIFRPGFAFAPSINRFEGRLNGRSSRTIVTMGMPAFVYRLWFRSQGISAFRRGVLRFVGIRPNRVTLIGSIATISEQRRAAWLDYVRKLGRNAR
jgi:putative NADPH-quinone reductase